MVIVLFFSGTLNFNNFLNLLSNINPKKKTLNNTFFAHWLQEGSLSLSHIHLSLLSAANKESSPWHALIMSNLFQAWKISMCLLLNCWKMKKNSLSVAQEKIPKTWLDYWHCAWIRFGNQLNLISSQFRYQFWKKTSAFSPNFSFLIFSFFISLL